MPVSKSVRADPRMPRSKTRHSEQSGPSESGNAPKAPVAANHAAAQPRTRSLYGPASKVLQRPQRPQPEIVLQRMASIQRTAPQHAPSQHSTLFVSTASHDQNGAESAQFASGGSPPANFEPDSSYSVDGEPTTSLPHGSTGVQSDEMQFDVHFEDDQSPSFDFSEEVDDGQPFTNVETSVHGASGRCSVEQVRKVQALLGKVRQQIEMWAKDWNKSTATLWRIAGRSVESVDRRSTSVWNAYQAAFPKDTSLSRAEMKAKCKAAYHAEIAKYGGPESERWAEQSEELRQQHDAQKLQQRTEVALTGGDVARQMAGIKRRFFKDAKLNADMDIHLVLVVISGNGSSAAHGENQICVGSKAMSDWFNHGPNYGNLASTMKSMYSFVLGTRFSPSELSKQQDNERMARLVREDKNKNTLRSACSKIIVELLRPIAPRVTKAPWTDFPERLLQYRIQINRWLPTNVFPMLGSQEGDDYTTDEMRALHRLLQKTSEDGAVTFSKIEGEDDLEDNLSLIKDQHGRPILTVAQARVEIERKRIAKAQELERKRAAKAQEKLSSEASKHAQNSEASGVPDSEELGKSVHGKRAGVELSDARPRKKQNITKATKFRRPQPISREFINDDDEDPFVSSPLGVGVANGDPSLTNGRRPKPISCESISDNNKYPLDSSIPGAGVVNGEQSSTSRLFPPPPALSSMAPNAWSDEDLDNLLSNFTPNQQRLITEPFNVDRREDVSTLNGIEFFGQGGSTWSGYNLPKSSNGSSGWQQQSDQDPLPLGTQSNGSVLR